jgi:hypothetical protein
MDDGQALLEALTRMDSDDPGAALAGKLRTTQLLHLPD